MSEFIRNRIRSKIFNRFSKTTMVNNVILIIVIGSKSSRLFGTRRKETFRPAIY